MPRSPRQVVTIAALWHGRQSPHPLWDVYFYGTAPKMARLNLTLGIDDDPKVISRRSGTGIAEDPLRVALVTIYLCCEDGR
jgi:hypothetical protein